MSAGFGFSESQRFRHFLGMLDFALAHAMLQRKNGLIAGSWMSVTSSLLGRISYHLSAPTISKRAIAVPALPLQQHEVAGAAAEVPGASPHGSAPVVGEAAAADRGDGSRHFGRSRWPTRVSHKDHDG